MSIQFRRGHLVTRLKPEVQKVADDIIAATDPDALPGPMDPKRFLSAEQIRIALEHANVFSSGDCDILIALARAINVPVPAHLLSASQLEWRELQGDPNGRGAVVGGFEFDGKLYAMFSESGLSRYDPEAKVWATLGWPQTNRMSFRIGEHLSPAQLDARKSLSLAAQLAMPSPARTVRPTGMARAGENLYFYGGDDGIATPTHGMLESLDLRTGQATAHPDGVPRRSVALAGVGDRLYAFGGVSRDVTRQVQPDGTRLASERLKTSQVFEPSTGEWRELPPLPVPREAASAIAVGDRIYVIGGEPGGTRVDVFNTVTERWETTAERAFHLPRGRKNPSLWVRGDELHISGGTLTGQFATISGTSDVLDISDPSNLRCAQGSDYKADLATSGCFVPFGDSLFAIGRTFISHGDEPTFLRELAPKAVDPQDIYAPYVVDNSTTNITTNNIQAQNFIQNNVTWQVNSLRLRVNLDQRVSVKVDASKHDHREFHLPQRNVTLQPLEFTNAEGHEGFFSSSPSSQFFLRTKAPGDNDLLEVVTEDDGKRFLVGHATSEFGPLPPSRTEGLFLYHPESNYLKPIETDERGQFITELPPEVRGEVFIFEESRSAASAAGRVNVGDPPGA